MPDLFDRAVVSAIRFENGEGKPAPRYRKKRAPDRYARARRRQRKWSQCAA